MFLPNHASSGTMLHFGGVLVEPPIWKICASQIGSFLQGGVKIKNIWNHYLDESLKKHLRFVHIPPACSMFMQTSIFHQPQLTHCSGQLTQNSPATFALHQVLFPPKKKSPIDVKQSPWKWCFTKKEGTHESPQTLIRKAKKNNE